MQHPSVVPLKTGRQTKHLPISGKGRNFLFLQGPHGPFFHQLGKMLRRSGARVWRVGFNRGDEAFWFHRPSYIPYRGTPGDWRETLGSILSEKSISDIVLYGDTRQIHADAVALAKTAGITVHVFEEGYLRPYWVTYERGGSNGHSRLMDKPISEMVDELSGIDLDLPDAPARWGDTKHHIFYGALYHYFVLLRNRAYRNFRPHRAISVAAEFQLYLRRLLLLPAHAADRVQATFRIKAGGFPYHLVLLQLEHDASFRAHSPFATMSEFLDLVIDGFAMGAPAHHHLVFKAHPLEDGRVPLRSDIRRLAHAAGIADRVHFVRGGKLARLLDAARSVVTVNSTAAQQALWRGLPTRIFGEAVYAKPEFLSMLPLPDFFANPTPPDSRAYRVFRHYLLETSQVPGGFYSAKGRRRLLRQVTDMVLSPQDPYDALISRGATPAQQSKVV